MTKYTTALLGLFLIALALPPGAARAADAAPAVRDCPNCPEMVVIPAGKFKMGDDTAAAMANEKPTHAVTIAKPFAIGKYEVTFAEWDACVADGGCTYKPADQGWGRDKRPVTNISWQDVSQYVAWLSKKTGKAYRLPSEAEWEYAARGGTATQFPWGDDVGKGMANCTQCGGEGDTGTKTTPVGAYKPNGYGLFDVAGNVAEWVEDCYDFTYDGAPADGSAVKTAQCEHRTARGGSWHDQPRDIRVASRNWYYPYNRFAYLGFRVVRSAE